MAVESIEVGGRVRSPRARPIWAELQQSILWVVGRRLLLSIPLLFLVSALTFILLSLTPGDAAREILGVTASPQQVATLKHALGLDLPVYQQYWQWVTNAFHGDLGASIVSGQSVTNLINERMVVSISLIVGALLVTVLIGVPLGVTGALRGGILDRGGDAFGLIGYALPPVWVGALLIEFLAVKHRWFPAVGYTPPGQSISAWLRCLVLPVLSLALGCIAVIAKNTRDAMLDVLGSEHIRMARANGVPQRQLICKYAMKNVGMRIVTMVSLLTIGLLGGTVVIETVFGLPGLGAALVSATLAHDVPVVEGIAVFFTIVIVIVNLVTDLSYRLVDPRVRS